MNGLTGPINFDARGFRTDFNLDIIELKQEGLVKVTIFLLEYLNHINISRYGISTIQSSLNYLL